MSLFLLVTHGSDGDVLPFVWLGAALVRAGHQAVLLTHAPYAEGARAAGLTFEAIDEEAAFERTLADTPQLMADSGGLGWEEFYRRNGMFEQIARESAALLRLHRPGDTVFVGRHTSAVSVRFAAELTGAPAAWIALAPVQLMAVPVAAHTYGGELAAGFEAVRQGLGLPPVRDWRAWFAGTRAEIGLWPRWFDEAGHRAPERVALTGFPLADAAHEALGAVPAPGAEDADGVVAEREPFVLATGGTGRMLHADYYPALVAAAGAAGLPTLLVVRHRDLLPARLPGNVRWTPGLPFRQVLPHAAAVVHHGGVGTLARALAAGTPQVLMADGVDRPDNAARLARHGLADQVPPSQWQPELLAGRIRAAVADRGYRARALAVTGRLDPGAAAEAVVGRLVALLPGVGTAAAGAAGADVPCPAAGSTAARVRALSAADRALLRQRLLARRSGGGA